MTTIPASLAASYAGRRCVVTGGLGFIGSNVAHALAKAGADVAIIDALVPTHGGEPANAPDGVEVVVADIGADSVAAVLSGADVVFNIAGQVSHLESMRDPMRDLELNVSSHIRFLETLRRAAPDTVVVQASTRQVYGRPHYLPVDELHPTSPVDVNGVDKLACEQLHRVYGDAYDLRTTSLRLTNVYGPRQHLGRDGLGFLPVFVRRALAGDDIEVFGDGQQLRDCLHVDDFVDAFLRAGLAEDAPGEVFNLGHTEVLPLLEIAQLTVGAAGAGSDVRTVPWPDDLSRIDIGSFQGDFSKAERMLGWTPRTAFADGIRSTVDSYRAVA
jgi:UDP-glucose 4-epimerase